MNAMPNSIINSLKDLTEKIDIKTEDINILPACHTSSWKKLVDEIIPSGNVLKPTLNTDYDEELLFFFYGKAKYIPNEDLKDEYKADHPFTLIYNIENKLSKIHRLVVFDSGGFPRYNIDISRKHFELKDCTAEKLKRLISIFFKNNKNYIEGTMSPTLQPNDYPVCGVLNAYCKIGKKINEKENTDYGEQAITFEIQYKEFDFKDSLIAVCIPDTVLSSDISKEQCKMVFGDKKLITYKTDTKAKSYYNMSDTIKYELYNDEI